MKQRDPVVDPSFPLSPAPLIREVPVLGQAARVQRPYLHYRRMKLYAFMMSMMLSALKVSSQSPVRCAPG